jgi:hypothetical protein
MPATTSPQPFGRFVPILLLVATMALLSATLEGCGCVAAGFPNPAMQNTYPIEGAKKDSLYLRSRLWVSETFNSSKHVIDYENQDAGVIVSKARMPYPRHGGPDNYISYAMKVEAKDAKVRVTFSDISRTLTVQNSVYSDAGICECDTLAISRNLYDLGESLQKYLTQKPKAADNW